MASSRFKSVDGIEHLAYGETGEDDDEVEDHTEEEHRQEIFKLKRPIDLRKMMEDGGDVFETEEDHHDNNSGRDFFPSPDLAEMMERFHLNKGKKDAGYGKSGDSSSDDNGGDDDSSDDDDEDYESFDSRALKMKTLVAAAEGKNDWHVKKKIIKSGLETAGSMKKGATVTIHYALFLENQDEPFDSSYLRGKKDRFKMDEGGLIMGLEIGIKSMLKLEKAEFLISSDYAFGAIGCPPRIPKNATVFAEVELFDFVEEGYAEAILAMNGEDRRNKYTFDEIIRATKKEHLTGNKFVEKQEYRMAAKKYDTAIKLLENISTKNDEEHDIRCKLLLKANLNIGYCYLKLGKPAKACVYLQKVYEEDRKNIKALYRLGKAKRALGHAEQSRHYLLKARNLNPNDPDINRELLELQEKVALDKKIEKNMCQKMFNNEEKEKNVNNDEEFFRSKSTSSNNILREQLLAFKNQPDGPSQFTLKLEKLSDKKFKEYKSLANRCGLGFEQVDGNHPSGNSHRLTYNFYKL